MQVIKDKPWYKSKTIWTVFAVFAVSLAHYYSLDLPYEPIVGLLSGLGLWGVRDAISVNK